MQDMMRDAHASPGVMVLMGMIGTLAMTTHAATGRLEHAVRWDLDRAAYLRQYETVFRRPIRRGVDALPLGNGDLAAVLWTPNHLTWMLNKCDISGASSQAARLVIETPKPIADRVGALEARLSLYEATGTVDYEGGRLPESAGWAWRGNNEPAPDVHDVDLGTVRVKSYVSSERNVLLVHYEDEPHGPHPVSITLQRWVQPSLGGRVEARIEDRCMIIEYVLQNGRRYAAALAFDGFEGVALTQPDPTRVALKIAPTDAVQGRLAVAVVTSDEANDPPAAAKALARASLTDESNLRDQHLAEWRAFWDRSFVDAGHPYLNALYHMALYELGATSRGKRPVKFNGALNLWNEKDRVWGADYWCHNQSEAYLPCYTANRIELVDNFHDWIALVRPEAVRAARQYFQVDGAYYPETMSHDFRIDRPDTPKQPQNIQWIVSSGVRYALLLWNRYRYTLDRTFLRDQAYPVIRDCAAFYVNYGERGDDGWYHIPRSMSWEERPIGRDAHSDCAAWRAIFDVAVKAAAELGVDKEQAVWRERLDHAPPFPIDDGVFSVVMRDDGTPEPTNHFQWQLPNLSAVFPYGVIGIDAPPQLQRIARNTFDRYRFNADAGHEMLPVVAARLGDADAWRAATFRYIQFFQAFDQGLFNYYNVTGNKEPMSGDDCTLHPYLEASGNLATATNEMLLQSHDGTIRVFPAVPPRWTGRFILRAAGSYMVAAEHIGARGVSRIAIQPIGGPARTCRVALPWDRGAMLTCDGETKTIDTTHRTVEFDAEPDRIYLLTPRHVEPGDLAETTIAFDRQYAPCRFGNVWYGASDSLNSHTPDFPLW